jgi:hypothetical protein
VCVLLRGLSSRVYLIPGLGTAVQAVCSSDVGSTASRSAAKILGIVSYKRSGLTCIPHALPGPRMMMCSVEQT